MEIPSSFSKSLLFALGIVVILTGFWEWFWRNRGHHLSYNEDNAAWANQRIKVDRDAGPETVIIGSSRAKFDLDLKTYEALTGNSPIQLAREGTCPVPVLHDLASDSLFNGTLLIDVTELLFFAPLGIRPVTEMQNRVNYYHKWTPAQRASFQVSRVLESKLVFFDQEVLSLNSLFNRIPITPRPDVFVFPNFPINWAFVEPNRQTKFTDEFLESPSMQQEMHDVWRQLGILDTTRKVNDESLLQVLKAVKLSIDKLKQRGVQIFFIKCPVAESYWEVEQIATPRKIFWDRMLEYTETPGVHFADYPQLRKYHLPEGSHLSPEDAISFTIDLVKILKSEKGLKANAL